METITLILVSLSGIYFLLNIVLTAGLLRIPKKRRKWEPAVSILIPARNEEKYIGRCLESVAALDYPADKLQVIVIDDHSADNTAEAVKSFSGRFSTFTYIKMEDISGAGEGKLAGLIQGFRQATGEIIAQTDADCVVPKSWIRSFVQHFDDSVGIVGGITILQNFEAINSCFTQIQSLDWIYLLNVGAGAAGLGVPLSCIGNNLAVRRAAYDESGGYEGIPFSVTEDFALFQAVVKSGWKCGFALEEGGLVQSSPPEDFRTFVRQRIRWASGGAKLAGWGSILLATAFLQHLLVLAGLPLGVPPDIWGYAFAVTTAGDLVFLAVAAHKINRKTLLRYFPLFVPFYYLYTTAFGLLLPFTSGVSWKGRKVPVKIRNT